MDPRHTIIITVFTNDEHPKAMALKKDLLRLHPGVEYRIMRADREEHLTHATHTDHYRMFLMSNSGIYAKQNTVEELKAVWKLCALDYYVRFFKKVIFLDVTTEVLHSLDELDSLLDEYDAFVLPQILSPQTTPQIPDEKYFLKAGLFHQGCFGFRKSPESIAFVEWWYDRIKQNPQYDLKNGFGSDQLWLNHILSFMDNIKIVKDPRYNINRTNLYERNVAEAITLNYREIALDEVIKVYPPIPDWEARTAEYKSKLYKQTLQYYPAYGKVLDHFSKPSTLEKFILFLKKIIHFIHTYNPPLLDRRTVKTKYLRFLKVK